MKTGKPLWKIYKRVCRRCNNLYETTGKHSLICPQCDKRNGVKR